MALSLYRKYRPLTFSDLLGQEIVVRVLKNASRQNKFSHAYLFAGPRGTGKTTAARLIAKVANCQKRQTDPEFTKKGEPCNECQSCLSIDQGRNLDLIEIDAASNRGIDEIRNLKESVRVTPASYKYKVFIIDEAHMLTKEAFNALLKTLEEPPAHVIIILATTEFEKIPATISSRTQEFFFKKAYLHQILGKIKLIAEKENIKISNEALELIAASAEGSFRDAESLLDQLATMTNDAIELQDVEMVLGKVGFKKISKIAELLLKKDLPNVLEEIKIIEDSGQNLAQLTKDLIHYLRRVAVLKFNPQMTNIFEKDFLPDHLKTMEVHSKIFTEHHLNLLKSLISAYSQMRYSQFPIIPLEVAIIEQLKTKD